MMDVVILQCRLPQFAEIGSMSPTGQGVIRELDTGAASAAQVPTLRDLISS